MRAVYAPLILLLAVLAGCTGSEGGTTATGHAGLGALVQGRVQDDQLQPLGGAAVEVLDATKSRVANATSDAEGAYDLGQVRAGDFVLRASLKGFAVTERRLLVRAGEDQPTVNLRLSPLPTPNPYFHMEPRSIHIEYGLAYQVGGDFNRGCVSPGVTCQGISYPAPSLGVYSDDPALTPLQWVILEETWSANSPVCSKAIAIDLYNPDAPSTQSPSTENPHYWTNYPHDAWSTKAPVVMSIPRLDPGSTDDIDDPKRVERNGGPMFLRGNWTVRHFPPGAGLTNLPVDANCFTDQKFDLYWSVFYGMTPAVGYQGRP